MNQPVYMRQALPILFITIFLMLGCSKEQEPGIMELEQAKTAITAGNKQWAKAFQTQNGELLAELFSRDGGMFVDNGELIIGQAAIKDRIQNYMDRLGPADVSIKTIDVWIDGNFAYESGKYEYAYEDREVLEKRSLNGKYVVIWKYVGDGKWKIYRDLGIPD